MRILFAGTPAVAVPALTALLNSDHDVVAALTRPPAPVGRKRILTPSPVHVAAEAAGIAVVTSNRPHDDVTMGQLRALDFDCAAVVAYGSILREPALSLPPQGWINLHFSLLPAWRGAAPVQYAIKAGDEITGATTFAIEAGLDSGPVYGTMTESIHRSDTAGELLDRLAHATPDLLVATMDAILDGSASPEPQSQDGVSYAPTLTRRDGAIDWREPALAIDRHIRGVSPAPGAWTTLAERSVKLGPVQLPDAATGQRLGRLEPGTIDIHPDGVYVGTGSTPVLLDRIAPPGKPWMAASDWARGARHLNRFEVSA